MKKVIFFSLVLGFFSSCKDVIAEPFGNTYFFENPQPINYSELSSIPEKFHGIFMNSDSACLNIQKNIILQEKYSTFNLSNKDLDSLKNDFEIINNQYISKSTKEVFNSRILKDSVEFKGKKTDTLFIFSNSQKMKRINQYLILNQKDSVFWKIKILSLEKNALTVKQIYSESDLKKMDSISKIKSKKIDSTFYILNPSRREFKKFLYLKKLGDTQQFQKMAK